LNSESRTIEEWEGDWTTRPKLVNVTLLSSQSIVCMGGNNNNHENVGWSNCFELKAVINHCMNSWITKLISKWLMNYKLGGKGRISLSLSSQIQLFLIRKKNTNWFKFKVNTLGNKKNKTLRSISLELCYLYMKPHILALVFIYRFILLFSLRSHPTVRAKQIWFKIFKQKEFPKVKFGL
jgi:hypothetical protein